MPVDVKPDDLLLGALSAVAPGTILREGLDHVISARTGALIVIGDENGVEEICNGGFIVKVPYTPQRLFELAKMDGAIILDEGAVHILKANVHLVPDATLPTAETGMRHRTAERVSRQTNALVISISQRRDVVSLYSGGSRLILEDIEVVLAKANQALQTLQRYRSSLDEVATRLTMLEFEGVVTLGDVVNVIRRSEMLLRVARDVGRLVVELGSDGRLVRMQADELVAGVEDDFVMLVRDYIQGGSARKAATVRSKIAALTPDQLLEATVIAQALGYPASTDSSELHVQPAGFRMLRHIPMLPATVINRLIERFGTLIALLSASEAQLDDVDGVGERRARAIREGLRRMREHAAL
jgi:diadenylate cyclase